MIPRATRICPDAAATGSRLECVAATSARTLVTGRKDGPIQRTRSTEGSAAGINAWDSEIPGLLLGRVGIDRCNARPTALSSPSACDANHEQDTAIGAAGFESCRVHLQRSCSPSGPAGVAAYKESAK